MQSVIIFPGQGSQKVGMGAAFINGFKSGMQVMEEVEDAISFDLSKLIAEGPIEELTKTENAQPAIFAVSLACVSVLEHEFGYSISKHCKYLAGHSLGEYSALCAGGVFSIADAARLVRKRGELMSRSCANPQEVSMIAILGLFADEIEPLVAPFQSGREICVIANDNSPSQVVISGNKKIANIVAEKAKKIGAFKAIELNTSGPFHSPLMAQAAIAFDEVLSNVTFQDFRVPVVMNVSAKPLQEKKEVHSYLIRQMTGRVRWRETMEFFQKDEEIGKIVESAPGHVLSSMAKRAYAGLDVSSIETVAQIEEFLKSDH